MTKIVTLADEFLKNSDLKQEELDKLKEWLSKQPHLPAVPDEQLVLFFHSCYFRPEPTKTTIDNYWTVRTHVPELFHNKGPSLTNVRNGQHVVRYLVLPGSTPEGYKVLYMDYQNLETSAFDFQETLKAFVIASDVLLHVEGTFAGFLILFNMAGLTLSHLPKLSLTLTGKMIYYLQEAMPVRLQGIHYINVVPFMDKVLATMKPFMKKELASMVVKSTQQRTLYHSIPKQMLPADLGGHGQSIQQMHSDYLATMQAHKDWIAEQEKLQVDEIRRPGKPKNVGELFGIEGSFRKLEID